MQFRKLGKLAPSLISLALLPVSLLSCAEEEEVKSPGRVALHFVELMRRVHGDEAIARAAYDLMWEPARKNLKERARRASALSGRELHPSELIVPSWFALHLVPDHFEQRIDGDWAHVTLADPTGQSSTARLVLEDGQWKVALELPPLSAIRSRIGSGL